MSLLDQNAQLSILPASQRINENKGIKGCIFGKSGIGKTSLLWTLPAEKTLFVDLEAGDLAIEGWQGDTIRPRTWRACRDIACLIGGADPALSDNECYSAAHYKAVCQKLGGAGVLDKYDTIFIDSITIAGRICFNWSQRQPQSFSERTGKSDVRRAYGLHGQEMIAWLTQLQHARSKHIWLLGILDEKTDEFNQSFYQPQIEGNKACLALSGIVDEVITMAEITHDGKAPYRAFVCQTLNEQGYPAKDRSGRLACIEAPHLGRLMEKIKGHPKPTAERLVHQIPNPVSTTGHIGAISDE